MEAAEDTATVPQGVGEPIPVATALRYLKAGLSVLPARQDGSKAPWAPFRRKGENGKPFAEWETLQRRRPTEDEVMSWYAGNKRTGIGWVCGAVSDNVYCIDLDTHELFDELERSAGEHGLGDLFERLVAGYSERSPRGMHLFARGPRPYQSGPLAQRPAGDDDRKATSLIDLKGEGGFIIAAPSNGKVNARGAYTVWQGSVEDIVTLSDDECDALFELCRSFDEMPPRQQPERKPPRERKAGDDLLPGDDFNERGDWAKDILQPAGFRFTRAGRDGAEHWVRPGKDAGTSVTVGFKGRDTLTCFSTSVPELEQAPSSYSKFSAYAALLHRGDHSAAASALAELGYGAQWATGDASSPTDDRDAWPKPGELPPASEPVPTLPPELIPEALRPWLVDIAARLSVPLEFPACPAVVALGSVVGRRLALAPIEYSDWLCVPNLWGGVVGPPGFMKSPSISEPLRPLNRLAAIAREAFEAERDHGDAEKDRLEAEVAAVKESMRAAAKKAEDTGGFVNRLARLKAELRESKVTERRYMTSDATVEKLTELLDENPAGLLVIRDELAGWLMGLEREGRQGDREFFLESWAGSGRFDVDRIGRGTKHVETLTLSVLGGIQPGKLNRWIAGAIAVDDEGADGLVQRLQVVAFSDSLGEYRKVTRWPDSSSRDQAFAVFEWLDQLNIANLNAWADDRNIPYVRFDAAGQAAFDSWYGGNQRRIRSGELAGTPAFASYVAKQPSLTASLALLFELVDAFGTFDTDQQGRFKVGEQAFLTAVAWTDFLEQHARKLYVPELNPSAAPARALAKKIVDRRVGDREIVRDIYRRHWSNLHTQHLVELAVEALTKAGWVRTETINTGGRPSEILRLNPRLGEAR